MGERHDERWIDGWRAAVGLMSAQIIGRHVRQDAQPVLMDRRCAAEGHHWRYGYNLHRHHWRYGYNLCLRCGQQARHLRVGS